MNLIKHILKLIGSKANEPETAVDNIDHTMKYLVVGLGNVGAEYEGTRHNCGFMVVDALAREADAKWSLERHAYRTEVRHKGRTLVLLKPTTYMNLSGKAVNYHLQKLKIPRENLLVVVDDLAIPFGTLRMRAKGSAGGHNGLKSIDYCLASEEYARLRVGTGNGGFAEGHQVDFVLGRWLAEEQALLPKISEQAIEAIKCFAVEGIGKAMTLYNHSIL